MCGLEFDKELEISQHIAGELVHPGGPTIL
jgi:hypothetical protein